MKLLDKIQPNIKIKGAITPPLSAMIRIDLV
jgi:hypothetical protein